MANLLFITNQLFNFRFKYQLLVSSSDHHEEHLNFYSSIVYLLYKSQYYIV